MARMRQKILELVVCLILEPLIASLLKLVGCNGAWWSLAVTSRKVWFDGAFLWRERPPRVKPIAEMSFRITLAVPTKVWVLRQTVSSV
jgi:hypothetical protein